MYSIIPNEVIFGGVAGIGDNNYLELEYLGERVQVTPLSNSEYVINRIISTSPAVYLNPKLQPGTVIKGKLF